ncbi:MAG TPA: MptD family putative ECF transporter S component [Cellulomonas sp.]
MTSLEVVQDGESSEMTVSTVGAARGLTVRDLITTGVFTALYFVLMTVAGMIALSPVLTFAMPAAVALVTGPVYLLLVAKVPKHGPLVVLGAVLGLLVLVTGMFWLWAVAYLVCGVLADLVAGAGGFRDPRFVVASFLVFSLNPLGSYAMLWIDPAAYAGYLTGKGTDPAYMATMTSTGAGWVLPAMILATLVCALLSALFGQRLLRRQFERAGAASVA